MSITFTNLTGDWRRIVEDYITDPENVSDTPGVQGTITVTPILGEGRHAPKGVPTDSVFYTLEALDLQVYRGLLRDQNMNADITVATDIDGYPIAWRAKFDLQYRRQRIPLNDVIFGPNEIVDGKISLSSLVARDGVPPEYEGSYIQLMDAVAAAADSADAAAQSASEAADTAASVETAATTVNEHIDEILAAPGHAQDAEDSAAAAESQAGVAGGHAVDAAASADAAASSAGAASGSATAAGLSAQSAADSASDALTARDDTLVARDEAVTAQGGAEAAESAASGSASEANNHAGRAEAAANAFDLTATSTTGTPGTSASVTVSGAGPAYGLDFVIPRGDKGDTGPAGEVSQAELDAAVASLVDGSPDALDTLSELASALGNDPNFATTISAEIGERAKKTYVDSALADKSDVGHSHAWSEVTSKPTAFPPATHGHAISDVSGLQAALDDTAADWDDLSGKPATFPPASHSHSYGSLTGKPSEFPPATHTHAIADVSGLQDELDAAASSGAGVEVMTRSEFDAITPDPALVYIVKDN